MIKHFEVSAHMRLWQTDTHSFSHPFLQLSSLLLFLMFSIKNSNFCSLLFNNCINSFTMNSFQNRNDGEVWNLSSTDSNDSLCLLSAVLLRSGFSLIGEDEGVISETCPLLQSLAVEHYINMLRLTKLGNIHREVAVSWVWYASLDSINFPPTIKSKRFQQTVAVFLVSTFKWRSRAILEFMMK